jgi:hypothetical protein
MTNKKKEDGFWVVKSTTSLSLWNNIIPDFLLKRMKHKGIIVKTKKDLGHIDRHDERLIETFSYFYGDRLERCIFATLVRLPLLLTHFYNIIQISVYGNATSSECIEIKAMESRIFYQSSPYYDHVCKLIQENTHACKYSIIYKGNIWMDTNEEWNI